MAFEQAVAVCDAVDAALDKLDALDSAALSNAERLEVLERRQNWRRRLPAGEHELINELGHAPVEELGGRLAQVLVDRLRIYRRDAARRIDEAVDLGPRTRLIGEPLPPKLEATAVGQRAGLISTEQVKIIRAYFAQLPLFVDEPAKVDAEGKLAEVASHYRPDELQRYADWYVAVLNPDGNFSDADRARKRGVTVGPQGPDGMSSIKGWLNPELRAGLDAVFAKWAAPGMCNPADETPTVEGDPGQEAIDADYRSSAQRNHDALNAASEIQHG